MALVTSRSATAQAAATNPSGWITELARASGTGGATGCAGAPTRVAMVAEMIHSWTARSTSLRPASVSRAALIPDRGNDTGNGTGSGTDGGTCSGSGTCSDAGTCTGSGTC